MSNAMLSVGALALVFALATTRVLSQSVELENLQELDDDRADLLYEGIPINELEDMQVVRNGEVIGEIEGILGDETGQVVALLIEHEENLLGLGDEDLIVSVDLIEIDRAGKRVEISLSDEELAELPVWEG